MPFDGDARRLPRRRRVQDDPVDQLASNVQRLAVLFLAAQPLAELRQVPPIGRAKVRHQPNDGWGRGGDGLRQPVPLRLKTGELFLQSRAAQSLRDGVEQIGQLPLHRGELAAHSVGLRALLTSQLVPLLGEGLRESLGDRRVHHPLADDLQDLGFELLPMEPRPVVAEVD
nr:hypothetical protein [uncultured Roseococcus sp.]